MALLWLPQARRDPRGRFLAWTETSDPKGCLHTTETSGWPGYNGWTVHPHATIMPKPDKGVEIEQNVPFNQASFSLRNLSGGVQTNTDFVFQFELIGTCEKDGPGYYWPGADDAVLLDLYQKLIKPLFDAYDIPVRARTFQAYPASYGANGATNTVRMSGSGFDNYSGWLGHQHVPENVHGDPGKFPWDRMIQLAEEEDMPSADDVADAVIRKLKSSGVIRAEVLQLLNNEAFIGNAGLDPGDPAGKPFTFKSWAQNVETTQDRHGRLLGLLTQDDEPTDPTSPLAP